MAIQDILRDLPMILGQAGSLRSGSNAFARRWQELEAQDAQRKAQQEAQTQAQALRQEDLTLRRNVDARASQAQTVQSVNALRQLLDDESLDTPDAFDQRMQFALNMAPQLGVEPGFVRKTFTPPPDTFTKRRLKKVYAQFEKLPVAEREAFEASGQWEIDGTKYTPATVRQALGFGGVNAQTGQPFAFTPAPPKPDVPNTPEEQFYQRFAIENGAKTFGELPTEAQAMARKTWMQSDDRPRITVNTGDRRRDARVDAKAKSFEALPIVKTTQKMAEAVSFANSLNPNTTNPADDQALIYAFAKAMDPDSVVREGEYATVQKYAQSWAESFGFNAARIFSNTPFLTPQSRQNMKRTIMARFGAARGQYDNARKSYVSQINKITGAGDGEEYLTDYAGAFPTETTPTGSDRYQRYRASKKGAK